MLVIFDLNKTLITPTRKKKKNKSNEEDEFKQIRIRPHFEKLYEYLRTNEIKIGIYSFCRNKKFRRVVSFLEEKAYVFDFLKNEYNDSHYSLRNIGNETEKYSNNSSKKDLSKISVEMNINLDEVVLIEDDVAKCVDGQNRIIVDEFHGNMSDIEFLRVIDVLDSKIFATS